VPTDEERLTQEAGGRRGSAVRELTAAEGLAVKRLAHSRTAAARLVERARIVWLSSQGWRVAAIAAEVGRSGQTVRDWIARFNAAGLDGLADAGRSGHPPTYSAEEVGIVIATALTMPETLGLPFGAWTLDRLAAYLHEAQGIPIKRSRIDEVLAAEGLRWRKQEGWFGERVAPTFAAKRGQLSPSTPRPQPTAS
jgi:transposase